MSCVAAFQAESYLLPGFALVERNDDQAEGVAAGAPARKPTYWVRALLRDFPS